MRNFLLALFAASLVMGASVASHAITLPSAVVTLGDAESFDFSGSFVLTPSGYSLPSMSHTFADGSVVRVSATSNTSSAFLSYGFSVTNANGPETYDFNLTAPIAFAFAGAATQSSLSGSVIDATGNGGTIAPTGSLSTLQQVEGDGGSFNLDLGPSYTFPGSGSGGSGYAYGPYSATGALSAGTSQLGVHLGISVPAAAMRLASMGASRRARFPNRAL